jgi:hypothetical protein
MRAPLRNTPSRSLKKQAGTLSHRLARALIISDITIWNYSKATRNGIRARKTLGERVFEFTEYLVDKLHVTDLGAKWDGTLTYHPSCHTLRGIHVDRQPRNFCKTSTAQRWWIYQTLKNAAASAV